MKRRIGILTSGGDCPGLNAAIRGVARAAYEMFDDVEIVGIHDGYRGLIQGDYQVMDRAQFSGILTLGGTILGTSRQPFRNMKVIGEDNVDKVAAMKANYKAMKLDCLVILGGNGTHKTANLLSQEGLNVIGLPKTIDNDLYGTDFTFGFHTAVDIATERDRPNPYHGVQPWPLHGDRGHGQQGRLADAVFRHRRRRGRDLDSRNSLRHRARGQGGGNPGQRWQGLLHPGRG